MRNTLIALALAAVFAVPLSSPAATWKVDKVHSSVRFSVSHLVISQVEGEFRDFDASLTNSKDDFSDATLTATINVASISTDNDKRDAHLKSADFLDAEKYPTITFKSTSFTKSGDKMYRIAGELTIRDVTKSVVLDAVYKGQVKAWGKSIVAFTASTEINRFDFGAKWAAEMEGGGLIAGEKVKIELLFEGQKE